MFNIIFLDKEIMQTNNMQNHQYSSISTFLDRSKRQTPRIVPCPICRQNGRIGNYRPSKDKNFNAWKYWSIDILKKLDDNQFQGFLEYLKIPKSNEAERFKALVCLGFLNYDLFNENGDMICVNEYEIAKQMFRIFLLYRTQDKYFDIEKLFLPETSGFEFMKRNYNYNPLLKQIRIKLKENLEKSISALSSE
jgi:hypothetical protein